MPWQVFHKRRSSNCLPAVRLHAGHPPLTSLRSFAPPYAPRRGRTTSTSRAKPCHSEQRSLSFRAQHHVIPSEARNLRRRATSPIGRAMPNGKFPPSHSVRGARGMP